MYCQINVNLNGKARTYYYLAASHPVGSAVRVGRAQENSKSIYRPYSKGLQIGTLYGATSGGSSKLPAVDRRKVVVAQDNVQLVKEGLLVITNADALAQIDLELKYAALSAYEKANLTARRSLIAPQAQSNPSTPLQLVVAAGGKLYFSFNEAAGLKPLSGRIVWDRMSSEQKAALPQELDTRAKWEAYWFNDAEECLNALEDANAPSIVYKNKSTPVVDALSIMAFFNFVRQANFHINSSEYLDNLTTDIMRLMAAIHEKRIADVKFDPSTVSVELSSLLKRLGHDFSTDVYNTHKETLVAYLKGFESNFGTTGISYNSLLCALNNAHAVYIYTDGVIKNKSTGKVVATAQETQLLSALHDAVALTHWALYDSADYRTLGSMGIVNLMRSPARLAL